MWLEIQRLKVLNRRDVILGCLLLPILTKLPKPKVHRLFLATKAIKIEDGTTIGYADIELDENHKVQYPIARGGGWYSAYGHCRLVGKICFEENSIVYAIMVAYLKDSKMEYAGEVRLPNRYIYSLNKTETFWSELVLDHTYEICHKDLGLSYKQSWDIANSFASKYYSLIKKRLNRWKNCQVEITENLHVDAN